MCRGFRALFVSVGPTLCRGIMHLGCRTLFAVAAGASLLAGATILLFCVVPRENPPRRANRQTPVPAVADEGPRARVVDTFGRIPLHFEPNIGQTSEPANFVSRGPGYAILLNPTHATFTLRVPNRVGNSHAPEPSSKPPLHHPADSTDRLPALVTRAKTTKLQMQFVGANPAAPVSGEAKLPGKVNYFIGNDPSKWHTNVDTFAKVRYEEVYPGIDVVYYGNPQQLEYDLIVEPGADPSAIRLRFDGASNVRVGDEGDLVVSVEGGDVRLRAPVIYQEGTAGREEIAGRYALTRRDCWRRLGFVRCSPLACDRSGTGILDLRREQRVDVRACLRYCG